MLKIEELMTKEVATCRASETLGEAAQLMWDRDCGAVPVLDDDGSRTVVGMLTDRDICMAAHFRGAPPGAIPVSEAMSNSLRAIGPTASPAEAEEAMRSAKVRRLPVLDDEGQLMGLITLADLARAAAKPHGWGRTEVSHDEVARTLKAISEAWPRPPVAATA